MLIKLLLQENQIPVDKGIGDSIYAGTLNESGSLEVKVTKLVEETTISRINHLVEEAQEKKAPTQDFVDRFARIYTSNQPMKDIADKDREWRHLNFF